MRTGKSHFLIGKSTTHDYQWPCSIAMLNYQRVLCHMLGSMLLIQRKSLDTSILWYFSGKKNPIAIQNGQLILDFAIKLVIFHSYIGLPEGIDFCILEMEWFLWSYFPDGLKVDTLSADYHFFWNAVKSQLSCWIFYVFLWFSRSLD